MSHISPNVANAANTNEITRSFLIRLTWDRVAESWRILIKAHNGEATRLFPDIESVVCHLETVMRELPR
ncbi:MAG: hypothetical protein KDE19_23310 [Caldilineaceae bacterium]|nr:hypothetical protein [Caldilineaceae bacterium]